MSDQESDGDELMGRALDPWRLSNVSRDWPDVLARAQDSEPGSLLSRAFPFRFTTRRNVRVAVAIVCAAVLVAPAYAIVSATFGGRRLPLTARLAAVTNNSLGVSLDLTSRGALVGRPGHHGPIRFVGVRSGRHLRRFFWTIHADSAAPASAMIVLASGDRIPLCAPCSDGSSGQYVLRGSRALAIFNSRATFRVQLSGRVTSVRIELKQLR